MLCHFAMSPSTWRWPFLEEGVGAINHCWQKIQYIVFFGMKFLNLGLLTHYVTKVWCCRISLLPHPLIFTKSIWKTCCWKETFQKKIFKLCLILSCNENCSLCQQMFSPSQHPASVTRYVNTRNTLFQYTTLFENMFSNSQGSKAPFWIHHE